MTINELNQLKESVDKVEFNEAKNQYAYNSSRKSVLGYTVAFANEKGGYLVFGLEDAHPHSVCGSKAYEGREGQLEQDIYRDTGIRIQTEVLLNRNQIKHLTGKLFEDEVLRKDGKGSGTSYTIHKSFSSLRGEVLIQNVILFLSSKYEHGNSPKAI